MMFSWLLSLMNENIKKTKLSEDVNVKVGMMPLALK